MKTKSIFSILALFTLCFSSLQADGPFYAKNGRVTLENLMLFSDQSSKTIHEPMALIVVSPGATVEGFVDYFYDGRVAEPYSLNQIIIGIDGVGAQDCLMHQLGIHTGKGCSEFSLTAPEKPGSYDIRFRYAQAYTPEDAVTYWWAVDGVPGKDATVGKIIVKEN